MKKASVIKNIIYSFVLQISTLLLSLVTTPYISNVLGAEQLGRVNFITAFASWFTTFSMFGIGLYGVRVIAKARDDKEALSKVFSELFLVRLFFTLIAIFAFIIVIFSVERIRIEKELALLQCLVLLLNLFSFDWLFQGLEDYQYVAIRSLIFRIISIAAVFAFVKTRQDLLLYVLISTVSVTLSNFLNILYVRNKISFRFKQLNVLQHLRPLAYFFVTTFLLNVYMMIDQTLLGFLKSDRDVALFARARMFLNIAMTFTSSINSALMPRMIHKFENDKNDYKNQLAFGANMLLFFSVPLTVGMIVVSRYVLVLVGNAEFLEAERALQILSLSIITVALGGYNYAQRVMPNKKENIGAYITVITAVLSVVFNVLLIGRFGIVGCAISYLSAELIVNYIWYAYMHKIDGFRIFLRLNNIKYLVSGAIMAVVLYVFRIFFADITWLNFIATVFIGVSVYFLVNLILKDEVVMFMLKKVKSFLESLFGNSKKKTNDDLENLD